MEVANHDPIGIRTIATYNSPDDAPLCFIKQWGIYMEKSNHNFTTGKFMLFAGGGADGEYWHGTMKIDSIPGKILVEFYSEIGDSISMPKSYQYLLPGDIIGLDLAIDLNKYTYVGLRHPNGPAKTHAVKLRVFADVKIGRHHKTIVSKNYLKLLLPESKDSVTWIQNLVDPNLLERFKIYTIQ